MIETLKITISRTRDDLQDYVQVMSSDQLTVNVVLIANRIEIVDSRRKKAKTPA